MIFDVFTPILRLTPPKDGGSLTSILNIEFTLIWASGKLGLIGFELGLNWVCFDQVSNLIYFHNPLYYIDLRSFDFFGNWVCFA